ncbi:MAG: L-2-amino-thiazoline-4-carboxylic acid hydrolase [Candidatus Helarchaeota archaeon]
MEEVNRLFSLDALILIAITILIFNLFLLKDREWSGFLIFHLAGAFNFILEIVMVFNGTRIVNTQDIFLITLVLLTLSWFDAGLFATVTFINTKKLFNKSIISNKIIIFLNLLFFIGLPLASFNWGLTGVTILTQRLINNPLLQLSLQVGCVILFSLILFFTGYKRLSSFIGVLGILLGTAFEIRLYLAGVRQASVMNIITLLVNMATLATMLTIAGIFLLVILGKVDFFVYGDKPPLPTSVMNLRISLTALKVLKRNLGLGTIFSLVSNLINQKKKGEPWNNLPPPKDDKDIRSRALIGDVIIIYRELLKKMSQDKAEKIIRETILEASIIQLYSLVPIIKKEDILSKSQEERNEILTKMIDKFPNTDWEVLHSTKSSFAYRINRCRLVELIKDVGYPELSDVFCRGDGVYFERYQPDFIFKRTSLIGEGQDYCDFIFELKTSEK